MKAMVIAKDEGGGTLAWRDVPDPTPGPGEILLRIRATGLNRADLFQRQGAYPARAGASGLVIAGLEAAGEVAALGPGVTGLAVGDRVMAMCAGGYAELTTVHHRVAVAIPSSLSFEEAASLPVAVTTEHDAIVTNGRLARGESVLINAASSCVGVVAIQIARLMGAGKVLATSTSDAKLKALAPLGVDRGINTQREPLADTVLAATEGKGVDVIIDHVGASQFADNIKSLALRGRLVSVGRLGGRVTELDLDYLALRRVSLIGVTFRTRTLEERIAIADRMKADLLPALADGRLRPVIDRVFPLTEALEAQRYMTTNAQIGKIVLRGSLLGC
jgi:NADPH2:quinone reductase